MKIFQVTIFTWGLVGLLLAATAPSLVAQSSPPPPPLPTPGKSRIVPRNNTPRPVTPAVQAPKPISVAQANPAVGQPQVISPIVQVPPVGVGLPVAPVAPPSTIDPSAIKWDAETKEYSPKAGEADVKFSFWLTNVSSSEVMVNSVRTSCGCTVAKLPAQPWRIPAGSNGPIEVTLSLAGKSGLISKGVTVDTTAGIKQLTVRANIPAAAGATAPGAAPVLASGTMGDADRLKNMQLALADRQIVFKNPDCAKCHADPAKGVTDGRLLYAGVCATCHNSHLRAAAVPDLRTLKHPTDVDYWRQWITHGRPGSMMPAYAESEGGPLSEKQINALADFMTKAFPSRAASYE